MEQDQNSDFLKRSRITWIVFSIQPLFFFYAAYSTVDSLRRDELSLNLRLLFGILALIFLMVALFLRKMIDRANTPQHRFKKFIFCWLANVLVALTGTAGAMISGDLQFFLPFFLVSILLTLTLPPRLE